jgi:transcriptional regulator with XRE-family HTH domain
MDVKERFAKRLKEALSKENLTQKELAKKAGLSEAYISQILSQKKTPTITVAKKIAEVLNLPTSYFLDNGLDIRILLRRNKELTEEDIKAVEAFIDYLIEKKNNENK